MAMRLSPKTFFHMSNFMLFLATLFLVFLPVGKIWSMDLQEQQTLVSVERIWDRAHHNAFTSLVRLNGVFYLTFRESEAHVYANNGAIRLLASPDGQNWKSIAYFIKKGVDLRDPKLSVTPDGRLMVLMGGAVYRGKENLGTKSFVSFSNRNVTHFSALRTIQIDQKVKSHFDWLWRITWHKGIAYGVLYQRKNKGVLHLLRSQDGIHFSNITSWSLPGYPNESSLVFRGDKMIAVVRRDGSKDVQGLIGTSDPPYKKWTWHLLGARLGGPALMVLPNGKLLCGTRYYQNGFPNRTVLAAVTCEGSFNRLITLPSGGDCSYPGLLAGDSLLYVSYYSSHEGKTSIYLARLWLKDVLAFTAKNRAPDPFLQSEHNGTLNLACTSPGATIHFTLDGSRPTPHARIYTGPFQVKKSTLLKMMATEPNKAPSAIVTVLAGTGVFQPATLPKGKILPGLTTQCFRGDILSANALIQFKPFKTSVTKKIAIPLDCQGLDRFGLIFRGLIHIPTNGLFRFFLRSNDGSRLFIDGEELIDNDGAHLDQEKTGVLSLQAGYHVIEVRYFQAGGSSNLRLFWEKPGGQKTEVPPAVFFHQKKEP